MRKKTSTLFIPLIAAIALLIGALGALQTQAQEPTGKQPQADPTFTYQGRLTQGTSPYSGTCDFQFNLWDALSGGTQIGATNSKSNVAVQNGYFNVELFFGNTAFQGDDRYLDITVNCGGGATPLTPRAKLTRAPQAQYAREAGSVDWSGVNNHPTFVESAGTGLDLSGVTMSITPTYRLPQSCANGQIAEWNATSGLWQCANDDTGSGGTYWSLTGNSGTTYGTNFIGTTDAVSLTLAVSGTAALRLEPNAVSPNVVGGYSGNGTSAIGAVIGGGGGNGATNIVTDSFGTISGGYGNTAGYAAVVGGGDNNIASALDATVGGGSQNSAGNVSATVGGGAGNKASGDSSTVSGGNTNTASNAGTTIGGGNANIASGVSAAIGGGSVNTAGGLGATVPGGMGANASLYGQWAYAGGSFASAGDAQASLYVMRRTTNDGAWENLFLDGVAERLTVALSRTLTFDILVSGRSNAGESAGYYCWGVIENVGGTTAFVGAPSPLACTPQGEDDAAWDAQIVADDINDALAVQVMGNGETIRWVATVRAAEVAW